MKNIANCCVSASFILLLVACASQPALEPSVDYKSDYNFQALESFSLLSRRRGPASSAIMSDMEMQRVDLAFKQALENMG